MNTGHGLTAGGTVTMPYYYSRWDRLRLWLASPGWYWPPRFVNVHYVVTVEENDKYAVMLCHDPRISNDPEHRIETDNPALIAAEFARQAFPDRTVMWTEVARLANHCDELETT